MYNHSYELTYRENNDTQYRKELLHVFGLTQYTDDIFKHMDKLYEQVKEEYNEIFETLTKHNKLSIMCQTENNKFTLLFSWDLFYCNHQLIHAILSNKSRKIIQSCKTNLIQTIKELGAKSDK